MFISFTIGQLPRTIKGISTCWEGQAVREGIWQALKSMIWLIPAIKGLDSPQHSAKVCKPVNLLKSPHDHIFACYNELFDFRHEIFFSRNFFYGMRCVAKEWGKWAGYIIKNHV